MAPVVPDQGARQGPKGRPVLYVLVGSLVLLGIYMIGLMTWSSSQPPDINTKSDASRATGPASSGSSGVSSSTTAGVPAANPAYPAPAEKK